MNASLPDRLTLAAFSVVVLLGGLNAVAVRFSNQELPPFWGAALRFAFASVLLLLIVYFQRLPIPAGQALLGAILYGILGIGVAYALIYWGLLKVQAGMAQIILALVPLMTLFFAFAHRQENLRWKSIVGALLAVVGIAIVFRTQLAASSDLLALAAIILTAACFAESGVIVKGFPQSHPITTNAVAMAVGALVLFIFSILWGEPLILPTLPATWAALLYLTLVGSCLVFALYLFVLKRWTASATSYQFVLFPFITIIAGAWLAHETVSFALLMGGFFVLSGVYVGALHKAHL